MGETFITTPTKMSSKVSFKNQPKLSGYEVDNKYNERRLNLVPHIENFVTTDKLFTGRDINIEFSHRGVSSLVSFIESGDQKFVLKIPLASWAEGEGQFLKGWESVGISVPHVFKEGIIGGHSYILMSFVYAPILADLIKSSLTKKDTPVEIGRVLSKMHAVKATGYGRVIDGQPEYGRFKDWVLSEAVGKRIKEVQENNLLGNEHGSISNALDTLIDYVEQVPESTYCHFDFGAGNMLATDPLTVIDPDPMLNNGIIDIGKSVVLTVSNGGTEEQLKEGYFSDRECDPKALQASILLNSYWKFYYWHKKDRSEQMDLVRNYLIQTKH